MPNQIAIKTDPEAFCSGSIPRFASVKSELRRARRSSLGDGALRLACLLVTGFAALFVMGLGSVLAGPAPIKTKPDPTIVGAYPKVVPAFAASGAIRGGFSDAVLPANDDGSTGFTNFGFNVNYFGSTYSGAYLNNNGNLTFDYSMYTFTPFPLTTSDVRIIAPFFGDVDTRGYGSNLLTYGVGTVDGHSAFGVTWPAVGYYYVGMDKTNTFQVILISRPDTGDGDFDLEFNYSQIQWEAGDASNGSDGIGGYPARVGFADASGHFRELAGSGVSGALLDTNFVTGLIHNSLNSSVPGRYLFHFHGGQLLGSGPAVILTSVLYAAYGDTVKMDASNSYDPDGNAITFQWSQISGPSVVLSDTTSAAPTFTAPDTTTPLVFQVQVSNGTLVSTGNVTVYVSSVATNVATRILSHGATLNGSVVSGSEDLNGFFDYGTTTAYGTETAYVAIPAGSGLVSGLANLTGLNASTTYHFRYGVVSASGTYYGTDQFFTTTQRNPPTITTGTVTGITGVGATIASTVSPNGLNTNVYFEFGTSIVYGGQSDTQSIGSGLDPIGVFAPISGLTAGTPYHYRAVAYNSDGTSYGPDQVFATSSNNSDANLASLSLSDGTLSPGFASSGTSYTATVPNYVTSEIVTATPEDNSAIVNITGADSLSVGDNTITVTVTAADGVTTMVYIVVVTRMPSSNANLADLLLSSGTLSPMFEPEFTNYTATVPQDVTTETITPVLSDSTATFVVTGGNPLVPGPNMMTVTIIAQDGTTTDSYSILVNRTEDHAQYYFSTILGGQQYPMVSASSKAALPVSFSIDPRGIALSASGNLYIADWNSYCVYKMTPDGNIAILAGNPAMSGTADGVGSAAQFLVPYGVAVDAAENVYVSDNEAFTIRKITPDGVVTTLAGSPGVTGTSDGTGPAALFNGPAGVAVDVSGNIYVADSYNNTIRKITPSGIVATLAGNPSISGNADGIGRAAQFNGPDGVAVDSKGNLFVADFWNNTVRKVAPDGTVSTYAGMAGASGFTDGTAGAAQFFSPSGVAVDAYGNLYVTDNGNNTIREVTIDGVVMTLGGFPGQSGMADGMGDVARFYSLAGIASDADGTLFIADQGNGRVAKGIPLQVTGSATVVNGKVAFTGSSNPMGMFGAAWYEYGTDMLYRSEDDAHGIGSGTDFVITSGSAKNLVNNANYRYRIGLVNADGMFYGATHFFTNGPSCLVRDAVVSGSLVTFNASVNPNGFAGPLGKRTNVQVYWEYGTVKGKYTAKTTAQSIGTGTNWLAVTGTHGRVGLTKAIYHFRVAMSSTVGITYGPDQVFSEKAPTAIYSVPATTGSGGVVMAAVVPDDLETTVYFQYGLTTAYTSGITPTQDIGNWWQLALPVSGTFDGLVPNTLYHYRMVTTNALGTVYGPDETLATQPRFGTMAVTSLKDATPGISGAKISAFGSPSMNDLGHVACQATISGSAGSGINSTNNSGIWADTGTDAAVLVVRTGTPAPGYTVSGTAGKFASLSDPVFGSDDVVAFIGKVVKGGTGAFAITGSNNTGIWMGAPGAINVVVRTGDHAPDASGSTSASSPVFASFSQLVLPEQGGVVILANLAAGTAAAPGPGGVIASNSVGVWAQDPTGVLKQVIRTGSHLTINSITKTVSTVTIFTAPPSETGQTRHFNNNGDLLYKVSFTDGTTSIVTTMFP